MGPFRMCDLSGNDIWWAIRKRRYVDMPHVKYSKIADGLCELGRFGQKTGAGWYDYQAGKREALNSPLVHKLIDDHRSSLGITPRHITDEDIVQRLVLALVNEGAHILDEGIAGKASDIDMVYLSGYGFPTFRGGPMQYADTLGLFNVIQTMQRFAKNPLDDAHFWQPAPLLARLVTVGQNFNGAN
jgi:3-hydroxyacyl-CoA dehydrogenase